MAPDIWSLAFFFRSRAASQTVIPLLLNGTRMSSSTILAVEGTDSFADSALSEIIFALFERGTSSSSSELVKSEMSFSKLKEAKWK